MQVPSFEARVSGPVLMGLNVYGFACVVGALFALAGGMALVFTPLWPVSLLLAALALFAGVVAVICFKLHPRWLLLRVLLRGKSELARPACHYTEDAPWAE